MIFVKLDESNIEKYIEYLEHALAVEPEQMHVDKIDKEGFTCSQEGMMRISST